MVVLNHCFVNENLGCWKASGSEGCNLSSSLHLSKGDNNELQLCVYVSGGGLIKCFILFM